jgi:hypothetical protein
LEEIERSIVDTRLAEVAAVEKIQKDAQAMLVGFVLPSTAGRLAGPDLPRVLTERLSRHVPLYMIPSRWHTLDALPLGPTGKISRPALLELAARAQDPCDQNDSSDRPLDAPPNDIVERCVWDVWSQVLSVQATRSEHNFFTAGGNSILAIQIASRIGEKLRIELTPAHVLMAVDLRTLTATVRSLLQAPAVGYAISQERPQ